MITFRSEMRVFPMRILASDGDVVQAARVSIVGENAIQQVGTGEAKLIDYLMRHRHGSPFEHNSFTFLVEAPIFVFREWHRHRVGWSYNEVSGRYAELQPTFYVPPEDRPTRQVGKPGAYRFEAADRATGASMTAEIATAYGKAWDAYQHLLSLDVAHEVARMVLPVGIYSSMYATCNARSLMHFLSLRTDHADAAYPSTPQWEIARAADAIEAIFAEHMPVTHEAWDKHGRVAP